jgi:hypothetical protein
MRGANCWTDHKMVRAKLRISLLQASSSRDKKSVPFAVHELYKQPRRDEYVKSLEDKLQTNIHSLETSIEENWDIVKSSIITAAEETVGRGRSKQPEWFKENAEVLTPLIAAKMKPMMHTQAIRKIHSGNINNCEESNS